jgi:hypothetical protein
MNSKNNIIDADAEAEADAIERLADLLGNEMPETRLQRALREAQAAAALGLPPVKKHPYQWTRSCEEHRRIANATMHRLVYGLPASKRVPEGIEDKRRRAEKRLRRATLLLQMRFVPRNTLLDVRAASAMSGLSVRVLERAMSKGKITPVRLSPQTGRKHSIRIRASELRSVLARRLAGIPVAA